MAIFVAGAFEVSSIILKALVQNLNKIMQAHTNIGKGLHLNPCNQANKTKLVCKMGASRNYSQDDDEISICTFQTQQYCFNSLPQIWKELRTNYDLSFKDDQAAAGWWEQVATIQIPLHELDTFLGLE